MPFPVTNFSYVSILFSSLGSHFLLVIVSLSAQELIIPQILEALAVLLFLFSVFVLVCFASGEIPCIFNLCVNKSISRCTKCLI